MIKVNDKYYITADVHQYILQEKTKIQDEKSDNFGKETFVTRGYYVSIEGCLNGIIKKESRDFISKDDEITIKEAIEKIDNIKKEITSCTKSF